MRMSARVMKRDVLSTSFIVCFKSWNPAMRSASLSILSNVGSEGLEIRSPRPDPTAGSLLGFVKWVVAAQREFLRIADVTKSISECRTCFLDTPLGIWSLMAVVNEGAREYQSLVIIDTSVFVCIGSDYQTNASRRMLRLTKNTPSM